MSEGSRLSRPGERYLATARQIGQGRAAFESASRGMLAWRMHGFAGVRVRVRDGAAPPACEGLVVSVRLGPAWLGLVGLCRVERVVVEADQAVVTYRTLAQHVEDGVQTFRVTLHDDGTVEGSVESRSRPRRLVLRRLGMVGALGQQLVAERYLGALARLAAGPGGWTR